MALRKAIGAVKDQTSIGLAKVGSSNSICDLDVAIVKATRHDEQPSEEKYIREILSLTCYSRNYIAACVGSISRRLSKTGNWTVALKTLVLVHRLLVEGDAAYEQEFFFATRRGTRLLNMSDFRDTSRSDSWDYSAFVRTFALYLDEYLEFRTHGRRSRRSTADEDENDAPSTRSTPITEMKTDFIFGRIQRLQQLLERFLACRPTGAAKNNRIVAVALYPMVKQSFQMYFEITEIMGVLIDRFMELEVPDCVKVHEIFSRISKQFEELETLYKWCKAVGIARSSEYPEVEKITGKKLEVMNEFIRDKSALARRKLCHLASKSEEAEEESKPAGEEYGMNSVKALPAPEDVTGAEEEDGDKGTREEEAVTVTPQRGEDKEEEEEEADFLNLKADAMEPQEHGDQLALALFDGGGAAPQWEAFTSGDEPADWETALVQSASSLSSQKPSLAGGFDTLLLDGMYQQAHAGGNQSASFTGSASSMALPQGQPMLALPAPPSQGGVAPGGDPFAASLAVEPPAYVRMSDMEKKQQLLVEEQVMWQQYARDGMQGQLGVARLQAKPYSAAGYPQRF